MSTENGIKGDPDCPHGETFNVTTIKQSLVNIKQKYNKMPGVAKL